MLRTETMRNMIQARMITAAALVVSLCAAVGYAKPSFTGRFTLPYEVNWGKNTLPVGNYMIIIEEVSRQSTVESADGHIAFFTPMPIKLDSDGGTTGLLVVIRGNEREVRQLNLPHAGISLVYQAQTSAEREPRVKADRVEAVPLVARAK